MITVGRIQTKRRIARRLPLDCIIGDRFTVFARDLNVTAGVVHGELEAR